MTETQTIPDPVDGKFIFQIDNNIRIRFNADGWVEEVGKGGPEDPLGTRLQAHTASRLDDLYARRYYDLYTRAVIIDIHPARPTDQSAATGLILFKDLEEDSRIFQRVNKIIAIANRHFKMDIKPVARSA